jgi:hypothetical protein
MPSFIIGQSRISHNYWCFSHIIGIVVIITLKVTTSTSA